MLLQFVLYLFQACGDAKSKPGFLSDKTLESSIKYIVRRFPSIDIKGVSAILFWCFLHRIHIVRVCSWSDYLSTGLHACRYYYHQSYLNVLKINLSHIFYLDDSGVAPSGPVPSPPSSPPTEASVSWLVYHWLINPFHHLISPSCHVLKGRSALVRVVIWEQSVAYHRLAKWVTKFLFDLASPDCVLILCSGHWGQGASMLQR